MIKFMDQFKAWYEIRPLREQVLMMMLGWALSYALINIFFQRPLNNDIQALTEHNQKMEEKIQNWTLQINALNKISESPLYKAWIKQHQSFQNLQSEYKFLQQATPDKQWQEIIKTVIHSQNDITLIQIKNSPETIFNPENLPSSSIYQQKLNLTVDSNYNDIVQYLQRMEDLLPYIHWASLNYEVEKYPSAKVDMEFSIIYAKNT